MDPLFVALPDDAQIAEALALWPELDGREVAPILVTALGDVFVETDAGDVWVASPKDLACWPIAPSVDAFEELLEDQDWVHERVGAEICLIARSMGVSRPPEQVIGIMPHPVVTGHGPLGSLIPMDLVAWHRLAQATRGLQRPDDPSAA